MNRIAVGFAGLVLALAASGCNGNLDLEKLLSTGPAPTAEAPVAVAPDEMLGEEIAEDALAEAVEEAPPVPKRKPPVSGAEAFEIQTALQRLGYDPGPVDGIIGPLTRNAIRSWQATTGQTADGQVTAELVDRLRQQVAMIGQGSRAGPESPDRQAPAEQRNERSMLRRLLGPLFGS